MMEGWGGDMPNERDRESPHDGDAGGARADSGASLGYPVAPAKERLLERRDIMLREMTALQNKVAGIDMALAILNDDAPIAGE